MLQQIKPFALHTLANRAAAGKRRTWRHRVLSKLPAYIRLQRFRDNQTTLEQRELLQLARICKCPGNPRTKMAPFRVCAGSVPIPRFAPTAKALKPPKMEAAALQVELKPQAGRLGY